jgi:simple sugar transport system substrate-binding protein
MMLNGEAVESGMEVPGLGAAEVDTETKVIKFNSILDITAENAAELGF